MLPEIIIPGNEGAGFKPVATKKVKGMRLPGSGMWTIETTDGAISVQEYRHPLWQIGCRIINFIKKIKIRVKEKRKGLRLEAVLTGELHITDPAGRKTTLLSGQYHLTDVPEFIALFKKDSATSYFVTHYPAELIEEFSVVPAAPRRMPDSMNKLIQEALHNPYEEKLRDLYYNNMINELLLIHLTSKGGTLPGEMDDATTAAVNHADSIIAANLDEHYTIPELSKMVGSNAYYLKKGFRLIFNTGVFRRLIFWRMEHAKMLLETTDKPIKDVGFESGYGTVAGFITAFGRRFGMTPLEWREQKNKKGG